MARVKSAMVVRDKSRKAKASSRGKAPKQAKAKASTRPKRSCEWVDRAGTITRLRNLSDWVFNQTGVYYTRGMGYVGGEIHSVKRGLNSHKGLVGIADDDELQQERLLYNLRVERGNRANTGTQAARDAMARYFDPSSDDNVYAVLPAGIPLEDICKLYPRHVAGDGLRPFLIEIEGWDPKRMWESMSDDWKAKCTAKSRAENAIAKALEREADRMWLEEHGKQRQKPQRSTAVAKKAKAARSTAAKIKTPEELAAAAAVDAINSVKALNTTQAANMQYAGNVTEHEEAKIETEAPDGDDFESEDEEDGENAPTEIEDSDYHSYGSDGSEYAV